MTYLELCNRVYSHIQSKDVREYYLNEIKDTIDADMLLGMIIYGYYSIEDKFIDTNDFEEIVSNDDSRNIFNTDNSKRQLYENIIESFNYINLSYMSLINEGEFIYSANFYSLLDGHICVSDEPFYGSSISNIIYQIENYMITNSYIYDESFSRGYIDKVSVKDTNKKFVRYIFDVIDNHIIVTNGFTFDRKNNSFNLILDSVDIIMRKAQYPFKNGDRIKFKTPLMMDYIHGIYYHEDDYGGTPYIWLKDYSDIPIIDLAIMYDTIFDGFLTTDWISKDEEE